MPPTIPEKEEERKVETEEEEEELVYKALNKILYEKPKEYKQSKRLMFVVVMEGDCVCGYHCVLHCQLNYTSTATYHDLDIGNMEMVCAAILNIQRNPGFPHGKKHPVWTESIVFS